MGYDGPNYTQTPNLFLDEHLPEMGHAETKVVLAIIRQTFGWHKQQDRISVTQFEDLTGLSRQGVQNGISDALERGVIGRTECGQGYEYFLVVNEVEQEREEVCNEVERGMQRGRTEVCNEVDTQKKEKETHDLKMQSKDSKKAIGWAFSNYQEQDTRGTAREVDESAKAAGGHHWDDDGFLRTETGAKVYNPRGYPKRR